MIIKLKKNKANALIKWTVTPRTHIVNNKKRLQ